ncbi:hypothetical protein [Oculatella sp. LEGE 06141]|uniref:hypothetical protein n=1 Tax=Oculatella sp. LEGE 06141 TaxID=1828648 RepID=UPI001D14DE06|nr:hypothetical protein [Oculatella sp. LEGE 06141]
MPTFKVPSEILLSLATPPVLLFLLGSKAVAELAQELGQASEEIFRGDRLPVLNLPPRSTDPTHADNL